MRADLLKQANYGELKAKGSRLVQAEFEGTQLVRAQFQKEAD